MNGDVVCTICVNNEMNIFINQDSNSAFLGTSLILIHVNGKSV